MIRSTQNTRQLGVGGASAAQIHAHLEKILASALFAGTRRLKSVLRYLVLQALNGGADTLNEYRIAVEAFDKNESFDPGTDPIVRVEMSRLRARLERYYDDYIVDDGITFELPKGTYALSIRDTAAGSLTSSSVRDASTITIGVSSLHAAPGTHDTQTMCAQLTKELVEILGNEPYVAAVVHVPPLQQRAGGRLTSSNTAPWHDVDFIVDGSIQTWSPLIYAPMRLIDVKRGAVQVLGHYVYDMRTTFTPRMDLPSAIMADIRAHLLTNGSGSRHEFTPPYGYGPKHAQRAQSARTIATIVDAAIETFADHGYFGATVDEIALRAQVADRFVLELFGSKIILFIESVRQAATRALDLPHLEQLLTSGDVRRKAVQEALLSAIRRWYSTLSIERARLSIYAGLKENVEYQQLIQEPIARVMRHLTRNTIIHARARGADIDIRAAAQSLIVFLIYFRVAPWSPEAKETHEEVVDTIVRQALTSLFDMGAH
jgi:AcrR family transcriptional regulator